MIQPRLTQQIEGQKQQTVLTALQYQVSEGILLGHLLEPSFPSASAGPF